MGKIDKLNTSNVIYALSEALDFVGVDDINHGKRVAYLAIECAQLLGWDMHKIKELFHSSLLHDCGVSSSKTHRNLVLEFDWEESQTHCITGHELLKKSKQFDGLSKIILYHHTHWNKLKDLSKDQNVNDISNLIFLCDRVDSLSATYLAKSNDKERLLSRDFVQSTIRDAGSVFFKPEFIDAFLSVSEKEMVWFNLEDDNLRTYLKNYMHSHSIDSGENTISIKTLRDISMLFAHFVDAKSSYTADHSIGVSSLAKYIAKKSDLDEKLVNKIEIAGLLHDLGKLKIPDEIIDKQGSLTKKEFNIIKQHSFQTNKILSNISGIEDITLWAAQHHEKLNGKGYPYHYSKDEIPLPSRIIAIADIFQALAQKRPYRDSLSIDKIIQILREKVEMKELDEYIVKLVEDNAQECWVYSLKETKPC